METALRRIADMLEAFADAAVAWFATGAWRPENWPGVTWALVAAFVVLSWLLAWRRRAPRTLDVRPPQLLVTSGEVVPDGAEEVGSRPSGRRRRRANPEVHAAAGAFSMTVSNLSRYPVQLLEVSLRDGRRGAPRVATVDAVVPAMGSVSVSGRIPLGLRGDGWLDLYCYAAAPRVKMHRHRVELVWEPWAARFKAAPLEQVSAPARRLASEEPDARFLDEDTSEPAPPVAPAVRSIERRAVAVEAPGPASEPPRPAMDVAPDAAPRAAQASEPTGSPSAPSEPVEPTPAARPQEEPVVRLRPPAASPSTTAGDRAPSAGSTPAGPRGAPRSKASGTEAGAVPRIATPPVGVAVTGRGGAAARTAEGLPIGRPTVRPERGPADEPAEPATEPVAPPVRRRGPNGERVPGRSANGPAVPERAPDPARHAAAPEASSTPESRTAAPAPVVEPIRPAPIVPTTEVEDEPPAPPPARRRPRLEFPDEF